MSRIIILHRSYGCDTGCCGHVIEIDGKETGGFEFGHPGSNQSHLDFAKEMLEQHLGPEHIADLDFENCIIEDD